MPSCQRGHQHGLDRVHAVLGLREDDGCVGLEHLVGDLDLAQSQSFVYMAPYLGVQIVKGG